MINRYIKRAHISERLAFYEKFLFFCIIKEKLVYLIIKLIYIS